MVDPTSELGEDVTPENAPTCATCDDPIVRDPEHVVVTWVAEGSVQSRHFCSADCRAGQ